MVQKNSLKFDEIGYWSEIKLDIIKDYASAYSTILSAQKNPELFHIYIDAFAGPGLSLSKATGDFVQGSPINALLINPSFREYHLIDIDRDKVDALKEKVGDNSNVHIHEGDCNDILLKEVFPKIQYKDYRRGLCLLDPYGLHLNWEVMQMAGHMKTIDIFLNFPVADINRNVLWRNPEGVDPADIDRMNKFWGDNSWRQIAYSKERDLFGHEYEEKRDTEIVADAFRKRLQKIAGYGHVPKPMPMRNSNGVIIYYLFFASQKPVAENIVEDIFNKYRDRGWR